MCEKLRWLWPSFIPLRDTALPSEQWDAASTLTMGCAHTLGWLSRLRWCRIMAWLRQLTLWAVWLKPQTPQPCLSLWSHLSCIPSLVRGTMHPTGSARHLPTCWHRLSVSKRQLREMNFSFSSESSGGQFFCFPDVCYNVLSVVWNGALLSCKRDTESNLRSWKASSTNRARDS